MAAVAELGHFRTILQYIQVTFLQTLMKRITAVLVEAVVLTLPSSL